MEKALVERAVGSEAKYTVVFKDGKLRAELDYDGKLANAGLHIEIGAEEIIEAIKVAIPVKIDDAILEVIKSALKLV